MYSRGKGTRNYNVQLRLFFFFWGGGGGGGGIKAGVNLKPVFPLLNLGLMRISRSRYKHFQNPQLISQSYV